MHLPPTVDVLVLADTQAQPLFTDQRSRAVARRPPGRLLVRVPGSWLGYNLNSWIRVRAPKWRFAHGNLSDRQKRIRRTCCDTAAIGSVRRTLWAWAMTAGLRQGPSGRRNNGLSRVTWPPARAYLQQRHSKSHVHGASNSIIGDGAAILHRIRKCTGYFLF